ncbi:hypothetical protein RB653_010253 [Dictyostelium firmibasis]|uniref:NAD(+) kinase n=1 Tax=Dictyostelium firmibasis TaxID=79012 RepID=A0AAN7U0U1_9MYCE
MISNSYKFLNKAKNITSLISKNQRFFSSIPNSSKTTTSTNNVNNNNNNNNHINNNHIKSLLSTIPNKVEYRIKRENNNPDSRNVNNNIDQNQEGSRTRFQWLQKPKTVLIIKKHKDKKTSAWLNTIASWLKLTHGMRVLVEPNVTIPSEAQSYLETYSEEESHLLGKVVDFVVTLGGDGTLLHVSSLFKQDVPPIISFHMGTLGFLMPFSVENYQESITNVIKGEFLCTNRMRLICDIYSKQQPLHPILSPNIPQLTPFDTSIYTNNNNNNNNIISNNNNNNNNNDEMKLIKSFQVLNEVTLHRGSNPHLTTINCTINGHNLSDIVGDGLIVATATGSTAYSMSCGGPMVHPCINCILLTPICPSSFSSKPALLPDDSILRLMMISQKGRSISATFDGTRSIKIEQGDYMVIRKSQYPLLTINKTNETTDWVHGNGKLIEMSEKSSIWNQNVYTTSAN